MVDSVSSTVSGTVTQSSVDRTQLAEDLDTFLTLLTSQLKNQDPLSPMDSTEFTNQLVQFAQVEQQINMNSNLEDVLGVLGNSASAQAVSYLDKYAEVESQYVTLQDGQAVFAYGLDGEASSVSVSLSDTDGNLVRGFGGETTAGLHKVTWDGTDSYGNQLPDGIYKIEVIAASRDDEDITTYATTIGKVTGVASDGTGGTLLGMGDMSADLTEVLGVFNTLPSNDNALVLSSEDTSSEDTTSEDTTSEDDTSSEEDTTST